MRLPTKVMLAAALICGPKTVFAHESRLQQECETRLLLEQAFTAGIGYLPLFKSERLKPFTKAEGVERHMISAIHPRFGMVLAFLDYTLSDQGRTVEIEKVDILNSNNFRKGFSNLLFAQMMSEQPSLLTVVASLADVNLKALEAAGGECAAAFAYTPLGKTIAHYGFADVTALECNRATHEYKFVITREMVH